MIRDKPELKTGRRTSHSGLEELWMEVGIDCDLRCSYCFNSAGGIREEEGTLSENEYEELIKQFANMGGSTIGIPGAGEPLLKKNIGRTLRILDTAQAHGLHTVIFTNGQHLTDDLIDRLHNDNISLMIKYNSSRPEVQDALVGVKGYTARRAQTIQKLLDKEFTQGHRLGLVTSIMDQNYEEIPDIFRYCRTHQIIPDLDTILEQGRAVDYCAQRSDNRIRDMFALLQKIDREEFGFEWDISPTYVAGCCDRYNRHLYVTRFGDVSPCIGASLKGVVLGNIQDDSLSAAWDSLLMRKVRERDYTGACLDCDNYQNKTCNSCLGRFVDRLDATEIHTIGCWNKQTEHDSH